MDSIWKSTTRQFLRSKSGFAGLVMMIVILLFTVYSAAEVPQNIAFKWNNPQSWTGNPVGAAPVWVGVIGLHVSPSIPVSLKMWQESNVSAGAARFYEYNSNSSFSWSSSTTPQDVSFLPTFRGNAISATIAWTKPGAKAVDIQVSQVQSGNQYDANSPDFKNAISQYILAQTGQYSSGLTKSQVMSALFDQNGKGLLSGPVDTGDFTVEVQLLSTSPLNFTSNSSFNVIGTSYGPMGTDYYGRPIDLGILAGLPNALELGILTSVVAVVGGVIFGGLAGYFGGRKDGIMQWTTIVFLALPALNFLVVISYSSSLTLLEEGLLISFLSWPFYAIIARTVALSIKSQTYIEADRAMGIPAYRTFFSHFMPRLAPVSIAYAVLGIPAGILLVETLGFLGIQPPNLITWGTILDSAFFNEAALYGWWWWVLFPGLMIVIATIPFVLMGFALHKIIAPRVTNFD
jgi:peptide/nickel transport system permease protein